MDSMESPAAPHEAAGTVRAWTPIPARHREPGNAGGIVEATATAAGWAITFVHYPALVFLAVTHLLALGSIPFLYFHGIHIGEAIFYFATYLLGGFGITALYHRAWTHNAVCFARPVEYILAIFAVFMLQMPARQWISTHVLHHQHTDSDDDPYNIQRGFWWAHFEWIIFSPVPAIEVPARLNDNPVDLVAGALLLGSQRALECRPADLFERRDRLALVGWSAVICFAGGVVEPRHLRRQFSLSYVGCSSLHPGRIGPRCVVVPVYARRAVPQLSSCLSSRLQARCWTIRFRSDQVADQYPGSRGPRA